MFSIANEKSIKNYLTLKNVINYMHFDGSVDYLPYG